VESTPLVFYDTTRSATHRRHLKHPAGYESGYNATEKIEERT
jgi:hypothetical protein